MEKLVFVIQSSERCLGIFDFACSKAVLSLLTLLEFLIACSKLKVERWKEV